MNVVYGIRQLSPSIKNPVVAVGVFDGLHRGHKRLIQKAVQRAKQIKGRSIVLTFHPHPVQVLRPEVKLTTLVSLPHRLKLVEKLGVDTCLIIPFTQSFSQLSPQKFIDQYLIKKIKPKEIFVGYDFRFGKDRSGDFKLFEHFGEEYGFKVNVIGAVKLNKRAISSTRIRNLVAEGRLAEASRLLGHPVSVLGRVTRGDARGKTLGYPTANIFPNGEIIPPRGVYAAFINVNGKQYRGMANIGRRPSFKKSNSRLNVEVHIFKFRQDIYGRDIIIEFIKKIRDEKMFLSKDALIAQLKEDERKARRMTQRMS